MLFVTKNEDTFFSCYLYVKFFFSTFLLSHHRTQSHFYLSTTHIFIYIYIYMCVCVCVCVYICVCVSVCVCVCVYIYMYIYTLQKSDLACISIVSQVQ